MKKRMIALLLVFLLAVSVLGGCSKTKKGSETGNNNGNSGEPVGTEEEVKLVMYLLGDKAEDFDLVYAEINKKLKERVNATLEVKFLSWAEHDTKYSLLFSGNEKFDLIFTASSWAHYETTANMQGFYELSEDFIKTYAPDVYKVVPEGAWTQAKIDGKVFMVPNYQKEYGVDMLGVRGDLMEKYGIEDIASWEDLEAYYDAIVENETGISPLATQGGALLYPYLFQSRGWSIVNGIPGELFLYEYSNPENLEIVSTVDTQEYLDFAYKMKEMYDKGYWSADSASSNDTRNDNWTQGKSATMVWNLGSVVNYAREINTANPDWKATIIDIAPNVAKKPNSYINNGIAINAASENPERAMMVINELYTNPEIYDLTSLGIEGVHWEAAGDNQYVPLEGSSRFPANGSCNWGWTNQDIKRTEYVENPDAVYLKQQEILAKWDANTAEPHVYDTFTFNEEKVSTEVAIVNSLLTQYFAPINMGMVTDVEASVNELKSQLEAAGIDKIYEELQKQAAEFAASMQ